MISFDDLMNVRRSSHSTVYKTHIVRENARGVLDIPYKVNTEDVTAYDRAFHGEQRGFRESNKALINASSKVKLLGFLPAEQLKEVKPAISHVHTRATQWCSGGQTPMRSIMSAQQNVYNRIKKTEHFSEARDIELCYLLEKGVKCISQLTPFKTNTLPQNFVVSNEKLDFFGATEIILEPSANWAGSMMLNRVCSLYMNIRYELSGDASEQLYLEDPLETKKKFVSAGSFSELLNLGSAFFGQQSTVVWNTCDKGKFSTKISVVSRGITKKEVEVKTVISDILDKMISKTGFQFIKNKFYEKHKIKFACVGLNSEMENFFELFPKLKIKACTSSHLNQACLRQTYDLIKNAASNVRSVISDLKTKLSGTPQILKSFILPQIRTISLRQISLCMTMLTKTTSMAVSIDDVPAEGEEDAKLHEDLVKKRMEIDEAEFKHVSNGILKNKAGSILDSSLRATLKILVYRLRRKALFGMLGIRKGLNERKLYEAEVKLGVYSTQNDRNFSKTQIINSMYDRFSLERKKATANFLNFGFENLSVFAPVFKLPGSKSAFEIFRDENNIESLYFLSEQDKKCLKRSLDLVKHFITLRNKVDRNLELPDLQKVLKNGTTKLKTACEFVCSI